MLLSAIFNETLNSKEIGEEGYFLILAVAVCPVKFREEPSSAEIIKVASKSVPFSIERFIEVTAILNEIFKYLVDLNPLLL
jgi:hypothetical protein